MKEVGVMKHNREFEIAWQGLKLGHHQFQYEIDDKFMNEKGQHEQEWISMSAKVNVTFDKHVNFFMLHFDVDGKVLIPCDRCGDEFEMLLWDEFDLLIKLAGEDVEEIDEDDDVVFIPRSETVLDISRWIYEFVLLSFPLQKVHPENEKGETACNQDALKLLDELAEPDIKEEKINNIWKGLDALKGNNSNKRKSK